jgi:hypothetical protein
VDDRKKKFKNLNNNKKQKTPFLLNPKMIVYTVLVLISFKVLDTAGQHQLLPFVLDHQVSPI